MIKAIFSWHHTRGEVGVTRRFWKWRVSGGPHRAKGKNGTGAYANILLQPMEWRRFPEKFEF